MLLNITALSTRIFKTTLISSQRIGFCTASIYDDDNDDIGFATSKNIHARHYTRPIEFDKSNIDFLVFINNSVQLGLLKLESC